MGVEWVGREGRSIRKKAVRQAGGQTDRQTEQEAEARTDRQTDRARGGSTCVLGFLSTNQPVFVCRGREGRRGRGAVDWL